MADSSYEKGLTELSKMKVADLKAELKQRGLPINGNKNELVERLQLAMHDSSLSLDETNDEILDEDAVLGDEEIEETEELENTKPDGNQAAEKRKLPEENNTATKKVILNRKNIMEEIKVDVAQKEEAKNEKPAEDTDDKKVVKMKELAVMSSNERLELRAKKFGVPLTDSAKKEARAARFNITANSNTTTNSKSAASIKSGIVDTNFELLKKRGERFGTNVSSLLEKAEIEDKKEKRKARFGEVKPLEINSTKIKLVK
ncbi:SAP domain-containing ribonucleoprotein [Phymastichus coffea]|uniref:SAP domain-containing ribonucleoprotein n=1 Tax=Phymastichus coffea TaxID=108790 RepID=UPI00273CB4CE|nr:SAP domain-containing ribonucleoprotein [Phymastichus coffea]